MKDSGLIELQDITMGLGVCARSRIFLNVPWNATNKTDTVYCIRNTKNPMGNNEQTSLVVHQYLHSWKMYNSVYESMELSTGLG